MGDRQCTEHLEGVAPPQSPLLARTSNPSQYFENRPCKDPNSQVILLFIALKQGLYVLYFVHFTPLPLPNPFSDPSYGRSSLARQ